MKLKKYYIVHVSALWYSRVLQDRWEECFQVPKCQLCITSVKEIKFRFLPNSNYFDINALYKRSYYRSIENVKGGSTLLFNGFIIHIIFVEFKKVLKKI